MYAHQGERFPIMGKMTISFRKLRRLLKTNNIHKLDLICECLEVMLNRKVDFSDVVERVPDHESERVEEI